MPLNKVKLDSIPDGEITAVKLHQSGATDGQAMVWSNANGQWQPGAGGGGGMADLVDDTSPQLGGDLDLFAKNIVGNGNIDINGHFHGINIELETIEPTLQFKRLNNANVPAIKWVGQAGVEGANIKFDGTGGNANQLIFETYDSTTLEERFRITYDGVKATSTDTSVNIGPVINLDRNSASPANWNKTGAIVFSGRNDADESIDYFQINSQIEDVADGTENGRLQFSSMRNGTLTESIFMNSWGDLYFQQYNPKLGWINHKGTTNSLYVGVNDLTADRTINFPDAGGTLMVEDSNGNVGIGGAPTSSTLTIYDSDYQQLKISGNRPTIWMTEDDGNANENFQLRVNDGKFLIQQQNDAQSNAQTRVAVTQAGAVGIGTDNPTAGKVAINAGSTATALHVTGSNTTDTRITIDNTSADADYTYLQLSTTGASQGDGYIIKNMEQGNGLPQGHLYLWTSGGTDNAISMVTNGDITKRATFNTDGSMTLRGVGGVEGHGMKLLATTEWTTGTAGAVFPVVDHSKYSAYQFYWVCDHAPNWFHTYLRMQDANGTVTNNIYNNNTSWKSSTSSGGTPDHNNASYYGQRTQAWLAGNGTGYFSQGMGLISFEGSINRVLVRGISQLSNRSSTDHYEESFSSAVDMVPSGVTGFTIYGSGGNSNRGYIKVFGIEK